MSDGIDLLSRLRERYTSPPKQFCCVCGGPLSLGMIGQGRAEWYCDSADARKDLRHWSASQWVQTQFQDSDVLAACDEIERLKEELETVRAGWDGEIRVAAQFKRERDEAREAARFCWTCGCKDMWEVYRREAMRKWSWLEEDNDE